MTGCQKQKEGDTCKLILSSLAAHPLTSRGAEEWGTSPQRGGERIRGKNKAVADHNSYNWKLEGKSTGKIKKLNLNTEIERGQERRDKTPQASKEGRDCIRRKAGVSPAHQTKAAADLHLRAPLCQGTLRGLRGGTAASEPAQQFPSSGRGRRQVQARAIPTIPAELPWKAAKNWTQLRIN